MDTIDLPCECLPPGMTGILVDNMFPTRPVGAESRDHPICAVISGSSGQLSTLLWAGSLYRL